MSLCLFVCGSVCRCGVLARGCLGVGVFFKMFPVCLCAYVFFQKKRISVFFFEKKIKVEKVEKV